MRATIIEAARERRSWAWKSRMRTLVTLASVLTVMTGVGPSAAMSNYKWKYRPLLVFAQSDSSPQLAEQRRIVATGRAALAERDVVVVWVIGNGATAELGPAPMVTAADLRSRYGVANNTFRAVLVGKDGGVKLSSPKPFGTAGLFATIDAMPMRRDEMRRR